MSHLQQLMVALRRHITQVSWPALISLMLLHAVSTLLLLSLAGEQDLVTSGNYLYYYVVTTSTVGYGDFSPASETGKLIVAIYQIPFGLGLFGAFLGKIGQSITQIMRRHMTGDRDFGKLTNHILIFGWHPDRTPRIIEHILGDKRREDRQILLCVKDDIEHPCVDNPLVFFAKLTSFTDLAQLQRVAIDQSHRVIVDGKDDNETFTTSLRLSKLVNTDCHISTFFVDVTKAEMLREHCHNVECSVPQSEQMLVRSIQDPGSSRIQEELLSTLHGDTQFSVAVPASFGNQGLNFMTLFQAFKIEHDATIIGVADNRVGDGMDLNPGKDVQIKSGQIIHYIAPARLLSEDINWPQPG